MSPLILVLLLVVVAAVVFVVVRNGSAPKTVDVSANVSHALSQAGLKDVTTSQDREKGVVTLDGHVTADNDKIRAESIARSLAGQQVVANRIEVLPAGVEADARKVNAAIDKGISSNLEAAVIQYNLRDVKYAVKNHLVTLTGDVDTPEVRNKAEMVASAVPNVQQVVNEIQVRVQKATSTR
ncbi:MAG: BON domain-containing protein [Candidatus Solibacter sp.]